MAPLDMALVGPDPDWYPNNPIKVSVEDPFYVATRKVLPWEPEAGGDESMRQIPSAHLERLLRRVGVPDPDAFNPKLFLENTLHVDFIAEALGTLVDNGLLDEEGDDGSEDAEAGGRRREFKDRTQLQRACDALVGELADQGELLLTEDSQLDDLEDVGKDVDAGAVGWVGKVKLGDLFATGDLSAYTTLALAVGGRDVDRLRLDEGTQFELATRAGKDGLVMDALRRHVGVRAPR